MAEEPENDNPPADDPGQGVEDAGAAPAPVDNPAAAVAADAGAAAAPALVQEKPEQPGQPADTGVSENANRPEAVRAMNLRPRDLNVEMEREPRDAGQETGPAEKDIRDVQEWYGDRFRREFPRDGDFEPYRLTKDLELAVQFLRNHHIVLASCPHEGILQCLSHRLADVDEFKKLTAFTWLPKMLGDDEQDQLIFQNVLSWHTHSSASLNSISFVRVSEQRLFDSLKKSVEDSQFDEERNTLKQRNGYVVCLLHRSAFHSRKSRIRTNKHLHLVSIDFLEPLLIMEGKEQTPRPEELIADIQADKHNWGSDDETRYDEIFKNLGNGYAALVKAVQNRSQKAATKSDDTPNVREANLVERTLLFAASHFGSLSAYELDSVMTTLLQGQKISFSVTKKSGREKEEEQDALDYWRKHDDRILEDFSIRVYFDEGGKKYLDFEDSRVRSQVRQDVVQMPNFHLRQFLRLWDSGIFFEPATPERVIEDLIDLIGDAAIEEPERFDQVWLLDTVDAIEQYCPDMKGTLIDFLATKNAYTAHFYTRFSRLCSRMLSGDEETRDAVDGFFIILSSRWTGAESIIFRLAKCLRWSDGFDYYKWIRHVLSVGQSDLRLSVLVYLVRDSFQNTQLVPELLDKISSWHPRQDSLESDKMSTAEEYSLAFLYHLYVHSRWLFHRQSRRHQEFNHPLNEIGGSGESDEVDDRIRQLANWLVHPLLIRGIERVAKDHGRTDTMPDRAEAVGEVLEGWKYMAIGADSDLVCQRCDVLIDSTVEVADRKLKLEIRRWFANRAKACQQEIKSLKCEKAAGRNTRIAELQAIRNHLYDMQRKMT